jgi:uncharacterized protein YodC (DUF2158 family)
VTKDADVQNADDELLTLKEACDSFFRGTITPARAEGAQQTERAQMTDDTFKPGDTVKLKSGGPLMTVNGVDGEDVICVWFEGKDINERAFKSATLKREAFIVNEPS